MVRTCPLYDISLVIFTVVLVWHTTTTTLKLPTFTHYHRLPVRTQSFLVAYIFLHESRTTHTHNPSSLHLHTLLCHRCQDGDGWAATWVWLLCVGGYRLLHHVGVEGHSSKYSVCECIMQSLSKARYFLEAEWLGLFQSLTFLYSEISIVCDSLFNMLENGNSAWEISYGWM